MPKRIPNPDFNSVTCSTGVKLRLNRIPRLLVGELAKIVRPKPPIVFIEDKGRSEENPNDPTYIEAMTQYNIEVSVKMVDMFILFGTEVVSIPDGMIRQDDPKIKDKLRIIGVKIDNEDDMYLAWIKYFACPADDDIQAITDGVGRLSGVSEKDVDDALANKFPNPPK